MPPGLPGMEIQAVLPRGWVAGGGNPSRAWAITSNFWSASSYAGGSGSAWNVNFNNGNDNTNDKTNNNYVRLVRGGE